MLERIDSLELLRKTATTNTTRGIIVLCEIPGQRKMYELQWFTEKHTTLHGKHDLWTYHKYKGRWNVHFEATDIDLDRHTIILRALIEGTVTLIAYAYAYKELHARNGIPIETYSLLISNVGYVRTDITSYAEIKKLYDEYCNSKKYEQVTLWSSLENDPIEEQWLNIGYGDVIDVDNIIEE